MMGKWIHISEKVPLKTERQKKCIPDSGVSAQTGPHFPSPKPRKQTAHIETHTSQLASVKPSFIHKALSGNTNTLHEPDQLSYCHSSRTGSSKASSLLSLLPYLSRTIGLINLVFKCQLIQNLLFFETTGLTLPWRAPIALQHQTISSHFIFCIIT